MEKLKNLNAIERLKTENYLRDYMTSVGEMSESCHRSNAKLLKGTPKKSPKYFSKEMLFIKEGHFFKSEPLTKAEVEVVYELRRHAPIKAGFQTKECYRNAYCLASGFESLTYCEGFAYNRLMPILHAWVSLNGKPIDVTWRIDAEDKPTVRPGRILERVSHNLRTGVYIGFEVPLERISTHILENSAHSPISEGISYDHRLLVSGIDWDKSSMQDK